MTSELALLAFWSFRQKLNRVSSVLLRRSVHALIKRSHSLPLAWETFTPCTFEAGTDERTSKMCYAAPPLRPIMTYHYSPNVGLFGPTDLPYTLG